MKNKYSPQRIFEYSPETKINYEIHGKGEIPIVFLHGFGASLRSWDNFIKFFPENEYTLYLIDIKGFGFSSKPANSDYTIEENSRIITKFLEENKLKKVILTGHSYGGGIALLTQIKAMNDNRNDLIAKLILLNTAAYKSEIPFFIRLQRTPWLGYLSMTLLSPKFIAKSMLKHIFFDRSKITREMIARYACSFYGDGSIKTSFAEAAKQIVPQNYDSLIKKYPEINIPVLIVWGENDTFLSTKIAKALHEAVPDSRLEILPACGHMPHEEWPQKTYDIIENFITRQ
jgi:pimeloyl-ACP methyl ester carboxylesterase